MKTPPKHYELSFELPFIDWDGKKLSLKKRSLVRDSLRRKKDAGLSWIMTGGIQYIEPAGFDLREGAAVFRELLDTEKIRVSSHHCVLHSFLPPGESQEPVREIMAKTVETCSIIRPKALVTHAGIPAGKTYRADTEIHSCYKALEKKHGAGEILRVMAENYKFMARLAAKHKISLAFENLGYFLPFSNTDSLPRLVDAVGEPNAGYCIDSGHAHVFGQDVCEWLRIAGEKLFETHFHDNRAKLAGKKFKDGFTRSTKETDEHLPVGFGTINWIDVIKTLHAVKFQGPVGCECKGWPSGAETEGLKMARAWWRECENIAEKTQG